MEIGIFKVTWHSAIELKRNEPTPHVDTNGFVRSTPFLANISLSC